MPWHWNKLFVACEPWCQSTQSTGQQSVPLHSSHCSSRASYKWGHAAQPSMCSSSSGLDVLKEEKMCLPWSCPHLKLYFKQLFLSFSDRTEKCGGVLFIGTRTRGAEEAKKAANQQNDDNRMGKKRKGRYSPVRCRGVEAGQSHVDHSQHHRRLQEIPPPISYLTCK